MVFRRDYLHFNSVVLKIKSRNGDRAVFPALTGRGRQTMPACARAPVRIKFDTQNRQD